MISIMLTMSFISLLYLSWDLIIVNLIAIIILSALNLSNQFTMSMENSYFMAENMSSLMVFLSVAIMLLSVMCSWWNKNWKYMCTLNVLCSFLIITFSVTNLFLFYFFFEASLIPTLLLIIIWGYQPERLQAGSYMMLYTVFASLPLLIFILYLNMSKFSMNMYTLSLLNLSLKNFFLLLIIVAFLTKLPMFGIHLWLPKAHVEAPLSGSMILAGILLKLGGYGLYLINKCFLVTNHNLTLIMVNYMSLWGGLMATLMCLHQTDMKAMVAYSSVAHMSIVIVGILLNSNWGLVSSKITMFTHGFTSSGLFILVNMTYKKIASRSFSLSGGLLHLYPKMSMMWFIFCAVNMAAPPSINLIGEVVILPILYLFSYYLMLIMAICMFFSAAYNMLLYSTSNHGSPSLLITPSSNYYSSDYLGLFLHLFPLLYLFKLNYMYM
uniref:NADH dehydrogenase subunit 4 n=1 Tax=Virpazaria ripkeni TaxID=2939667 RepID=UPI002027FC57|nr:NADH dehydrogenase subunit 4 [Virpazaria ripkeni]UPV69730.1 NADH dehydrogenase subunit 4 [Virpazaria ripkeni]UPV69743.1 NADH dehydrogenase subunit 4 [Virpazaria ripkeni]